MSGRKFWLIAGVGVIVIVVAGFIGLWAASFVIERAEKQAELSVQLERLETRWASIRQAVGEIIDDGCQAGELATIHELHGEDIINIYRHSEWVAQDYLSHFGDDSVSRAALELAREADEMAGLGWREDCPPIEHSELGRGFIDELRELIDIPDRVRELANRLSLECALHDIPSELDLDELSKNFPIMEDTIARELVRPASRLAEINASRGSLELTADDQALLTILGSQLEQQIADQPSQEELTETFAVCKEKIEAARSEAARSQM